METSPFGARCSAAFEAVMAFAIDDPTIDDTKASLLAMIGLDEDSFYDDEIGLYIKRSKVEDVRDKHLVGSRIVLVYGYPGTGKTTVVMKAIREVKIESPCKLFHVDFRAKEALLGVAKDRDIATIIHDRLRADSVDYCTNRGVSDFDIVTFFLTPEMDEYSKSETFSESRRSLYNEYTVSGDTASTSFHDWISDTLRNPPERFRNLMDELVSALRLQDYFYFINYAMPSPDGEKIGERVLIFFDNIDSIYSNEVRDHFLQFVRNFHGQVGHCAKIVFTSRTGTIAKHNWDDYGAHIADDIQIDYMEFKDEQKFEDEVKKQAERKGYCSLWDRYDIERRLEQVARDEFCRLLLLKRTEFLERLRSEEYNLAFLHGEEYDDLKKLYEMAYMGSRISSPIFELANYDRRMMFVHLCNLVRFVHEELDMKIDSLGTSEDEKQFVLESLFYASLNDRESIFKYDVYNVFGELQPGSPEGGPLGCSLTNLLLCVIYKKTNRKRGTHQYGGNAKIGEVVKQLEEIGYDKTHIKTRLFDIYITDGRYHGLIETSRYAELESADDLSDNDPIWLTPRAAHLCEYLSHKFIYMLSCLRKNEWKVDDKKFTYSDKNPITLGSLLAVLKFLMEVADLHSKAIKKIGDRLKEKKGKWYEYYKRWYCISSFGKTGLLGSAYLGELQLNNILRSHIQFLRRQSTVEGFEWIDNLQVVEDFRKLKEQFNNAVEDTVEQNLDVKEGRFEGCVDFTKYYSEESDGQNK